MSSKPKRLLAKSFPKNLDSAPESVYLHGHTQDVIDAAEALFGTPENATRLGQCWLSFFRLPHDHYVTFIRSVRAAAALHDWGKANSGFQNAVRRTGEQIIRHEHLSGLLMELPKIRQWFEKAKGIDWDCVLAAVVSHHLKISEQTVGEKLTEGEHFRYHMDHEDFQQLADVTAKCLGLEPPPISAILPFWTFEQEVPLPVFQNTQRLREQLKERLLDIDRRVNAEGDQAREKRRLLQAVRSALIAADAAGSATVRIGGGHVEWIRKMFNEADLLDGNKIASDVIKPRIEQLKALKKWDTTRGDNGWSEFQLECAKKPDRTLLLAPCGAGKTLAAWKWIEQQLHDRKVARVIFLYPTRATATEGFRDYVSWAPEAASLMHGTAAYELQDLFENPQDPQDFRKIRRYTPDPRLYSIAYWEKRIFSATVDQFFAFLQHAYGPTALLPVLADSVIVVDEVHSFDKRMFSALKQFLVEFNVPVLCMTATLPDGSIEELKKCELTPYNEKPGELQAIANRPRYQIQRSNLEAAKKAVLLALGEGKRVLWVVNTVDRAQQLADDPSLIEAGRLICYHSRFKLDDRKQRHEEVVSAFKGSSSATGILAVSTQVCEMSLDLDADVLVTEQAPITALIQRMGRCVRDNAPKSTPEGQRVGQVYVIDPPDPLPYHAEQLTGSEQFLEEVSKEERICSQQDLEDALQEHAPDEPLLDRACQFFASGPFALAGEDTFRDIGEEFTVQGILDSDIETYLTCAHARKPGLVVPFPISLAMEQDSRLPRFLRVAPSANYTPVLGFRKPNKNKEGR